MHTFLAGSGELEQFIKVNKRTVIELATFLLQKHHKADVLRGT